MISIFSIIGLGISSIGFLLPFFVILFPKLSSVSIYRKFQVKRFTLLIVGLGLIGIDFYLENFSEITILFIFWLLLAFFSILTNPKMIFRSISNPHHYKIAETSKFSIKNEDMIIGYVSESSQAYAWPLKEMVKPRHVINEKLEGKPLLVTYCPLCKSGLVFDPVVNNQGLIFEVAGLYRRNMVLIDKQTKTIWQQATGEAINGKLLGTNLELLFYEIMTWEGWKNDYPDTYLAWEKKKEIGIRILHSILKKLLERAKMPKFPGKTKLGKDLDPHEEIFGIKINNNAKAYPSSVFRTEQTIKDKIDGVDIELTYDEIKNSVKGFVKNNEEIKPLIVERHNWFSWKEFYPQTQIYSV